MPYNDENDPSEPNTVVVEPATLPWWQSKVLWTGLIQVIIGSAATFGIIDAVTAKKYTGMAPEVISGILSSLVGIATVWYRIKATAQPVTLTDENARKA